MQPAPSLSASQREAILELATRGSGGSFEPSTLSELFNLGLVEIRSQDRHLVLTQRGQSAYQALTTTPAGRRS